MLSVATDGNACPDVWFRSGLRGNGAPDDWQVPSAGNWGIAEAVQSRVPLKIK
jgi:hypothetical protein